MRGEFRPDGIEREWCDDDVLRQLRRRSLAALRKEVEPVDAAALARFLPEWQGVGAPRRGLDALVEAIGSLQGAALPASTLEADVLSARVAGYQPADLDALCTSGEVVWVGAGPLGPTDGRVRLLFRDQAALLVPARPPSADDGSPEPLGRPGCTEVLRGRTWRRPQAARRSGPIWWRRWPPPTSRPTTRPCSTPCGIWCGPARSPTTPSPRCGRCRAAAGAPRRGRAGSPVRRLAAAATPARSAVAGPRPASRSAPTAGG